MKKFLLLMSLALGIISCQDDPEPVLSVSQSSITFDAASTQAVTVNVNANYEWTASSSESWITLTPSVQKNVSTLSIKADNNNTYSERNAIITLYSKELTSTITVKQEQNNAIIVSENLYTLGKEGQTFSVNVKSNVDWIVEMPKADWISDVTNSTRALSEKNVSFKVMENDTYEIRTAAIILSDSKSGEKQTINVNQDCDYLLESLDATAINVKYEPSTSEIKVKSNVALEIISGQEDWFKVTLPTITTGKLSTDAVKIEVSKNEGTSIRNATLVIGNKNKSKELKINIKQTPSLAFEKESYEITIGKTEELNVLGASGKLTWKSSDETVAKVDDKGVVTSIKKGETIITVTTSEGVSASCKVTIVVPDITFENAPSTLMIGGTKKLSVKDAIGKLTWKSSDPTIVYVDNSGNITAKKKGDATITVTSEYGASTSCKITVKDITDCVTIARTGISTVVSNLGIRYSVTFTIQNTSSETIQIKSLGGVTNGVASDLAGGKSVSFTLSSTTAAIQNYQQTLVYTYNGKEYKINV